MTWQTCSTPVTCRSVSKISYALESGPLWSKVGSLDIFWQELERAHSLSFDTSFFSPEELFPPQQYSPESGGRYHHSAERQKDPCLQAESVGMMAPSTCQLHYSHDQPLHDTSLLSGPSEAGESQFQLASCHEEPALAQAFICSPLYRMKSAENACHAVHMSELVLGEDVASTGWQPLHAAELSESRIAVSPFSASKIQAAESLMPSPWAGMQAPYRAISGRLRAAHLLAVVR